MNRRRALPPTSVRADVVSVGATSALAVGALELAMQLRAGSRMPPLASFEGRAGFAAPDLGPDLGRDERLRALASTALAEAHDGRAEALPLIVALPRQDEPVDEFSELSAIAAAAEVTIDPERSRVVRGGGASGASAIELAMQRLADVPAVLVGGADSPFSAPGGSSTERRGEAAAMLLLTRPGGQPTAHARLIAAASERGEEDIDEWRKRAARFELARRDGGSARALAAAKHGLNERDIDDELLHRRADGRSWSMVEALLSARAALNGTALSWGFSDLGESVVYRREWGDVVADTRLTGFDDLRATSQLGVIGAANASVGLALMWWWWRAGCAPADRALIALHEDSPLRSVLLVERGAAPLDEQDEGRAIEIDAGMAAALDQVRDDIDRLIAAEPDTELEPLARAAELLTVVRADRAADLERLEALDGAASALRSAEAAREGDSAALLSRARGLLESSRVGLLGRIRLSGRTPERRDDAVPRFVVSTVLPRLRRLRAPQLQAFATYAETSSAFGTPPTDGDWRTGAAWAHFDNIARSALIRGAGGDESVWTPALERLDEQVRREIDALASLEVRGALGVLDALSAYAPPASRWPDRSYARALVLGCTRGDEAARAALAALKLSPPNTRSRQSAALQLAPSPALRAELHKLLGHRDASLVVLAIDALVARNEVTLAALLPLESHPQVDVRERVAAALGSATEREAARSVVAAMLDEERDDVVRARLAGSLLRLGDANALRWARDELGNRGATLETPAQDILAMLLATGGDAADLELLLALPPSPARVSSLAWLGHLGAVEPLVAIIEEDDMLSAGGLAQTTARALYRITGAITPSASRRPWQRADTVALSPARWRAWLETTTLSFDDKHRFGEPFAPSIVIDELWRSGVPADVRATAYGELALLFGGLPLPPANDWQARQRAALDALADVARDGPAPGSWPAAWRRHHLRIVERKASVA